MIVYPKDGWILERSGRELDGLEVPGTYFINYALFDETKQKPWGAFFTHREEANGKLFDDVAGKVEYAVCLNANVKDYLERKGVKKVVIIRHGCDERVKKKPVFGWCGRKYKSGRKGEELLDGLEVEYGNYENAPEFYRKIDYLLVTSRIEGGPVPVIDAIAAGVPVIARKGLGWVDSFPIIPYQTDTEFMDIIYKLTHPPTWDDWREGHQKLFKEIGKEYV